MSKQQDERDQALIDQIDRELENAKSQRTHAMSRKEFIQARDFIEQLERDRGLVLKRLNGD